MSEQTKNLLGGNYNPDVLECLANLSNDEVFTPPKVVNQMLDMFPSETWSNPNLKFLDPACKTGVFLREIAKRLIVGLEDEIPNLNRRLDHIFKNQLYGIAITELTALTSRRTLYCSKYANGKYSVAKGYGGDTGFQDPYGNIRFVPINHTWENGKCKYCGASASQYQRADDLETHAYEFIHTNNPEEIFGMKFDVIIGNPPYHMTFGLSGGNNANAKSIYNLFMQNGIKMKPKYFCMITPSRWMTKTAQGIPETWVDSMINSNKISILHDFENSAECFPGVVIEGGVSYFIYDRDYYGPCEYYYHKGDNKTVNKRRGLLNEGNVGIVVRNPIDFEVISKIEAVEGKEYYNTDKSFSNMISPKHYFDDSQYLTSNWTGYSNERTNEYCIKYYLNVDRERTFRWISEKQLPKNKQTKDLHKVFIPAAAGNGNGKDSQILGRPLYGEPGSVCSQTFLVIGYRQKDNLTKEECENIIDYIKTRFFRYLVSIKKKTQNGPRGVYQFVPMVDFSRKWTDDELYEKYKLSANDINYIEDIIKPMEDK